MISAAQLLDELMGRDRNLAPDEKRSNVRWDHESVSVAELGPPSVLSGLLVLSRFRGLGVGRRKRGIVRSLPGRA